MQTRICKFSIALLCQLRLYAPVRCCHQKVQYSILLVTTHSNGGGNNHDKVGIATFFKSSIISDIKKVLAISFIMLITFFVTANKSSAQDWIEKIQL